jgi:hypothetical protein
MEVMEVMGVMGVMEVGMVLKINIKRMIRFTVSRMK